jgi:hypothetical protein
MRRRDAARTMTLQRRPAPIPRFGDRLFRPSHRPPGEGSKATGFGVIHARPSFRKSSGFPHLAKLTAGRSGIVAILLTGIPSGIIPGFQNSTGKRYLDLLGSMWRSSHRASRASRGARR